MAAGVATESADAVTSLNCMLAAAAQSQMSVLAGALRMDQQNGRGWLSAVTVKAGNGSSVSAKVGVDWARPCRQVNPWQLGLHRSPLMPLFP